MAGYNGGSKFPCLGSESRCFAKDACPLYRIITGQAEVPYGCRHYQDISGPNSWQPEEKITFAVTRIRDQMRLACTHYVLGDLTGEVIRTYFFAAKVKRFPLRPENDYMSLEP